MNESPRDYKVAEVAEKYGVHINTVRNWIRDGVLPAYRIGARTIRIRSTDVAAVATPLEGGDRGLWSRIA